MNNDSIDFSKFLPEQTYNPNLHSDNESQSSKFTVEESSRLTFKIASPAPSVFFDEFLLKKTVRTMNLQILFFVLGGALAFFTFAYTIILLTVVVSGKIDSVEAGYVYIYIGLFVACISALVLGAHYLKRTRAAFKPLNELVHSETKKVSSVLGGFLEEHNINFAFMTLINNPKSSKVFEGVDDYAGLRFEVSLEQSTNSIVVAIQDVKTPARETIEKLLVKA